MLSDIIYPAFPAPKPLRGIITTQFLDQICSYSGNLPVEFNGVYSAKDDVVRPHGIDRGKRGAAKYTRHVAKLWTYLCNHHHLLVE